MTRTFLLFLLVLFFLRFVWRLMGGVIQGATTTSSARDAGQQPAVRMVRDPVCGTYVVPGKALELARGRETIYFCSDKCRDEFAKK
jgi:YHS domain-containing protein